MKLIFLGIIQGLTEFLPISSDGHLYFFKKTLGISGDLLSFFVFLHLATLLAISIFFWKKIITILTNKKVLIHLFIITLITGLIGIAIEHIFEKIFELKYLIAGGFLINSLIIFSAKPNGARTINQIKFYDSIWLGVLQGLAVFPGISRSGITISALLKKGFQKQEAFQLSFIMAIPAILGAFIYKLKDFNKLSALQNNISNLFLPFLSAFIFGLIALIVVRKLVINDKFRNFGYYCLVIALITLFT